MDEKLLEKIASSLTAIETIDLWLPEAIDDAVNGTRHTGTLDRVDVDRMVEKKTKDEKDQKEITELISQSREIQKQTKYLFLGMIITLVATLTSITLQVIQFKIDNP